MRIAILSPDCEPNGPNNVVRALLPTLTADSEVRWFALASRTTETRVSLGVEPVVARVPRILTWLPWVDHFDGQLTEFAPDVLFVHGLRPTIVGAYYSLPSLSVVHSELDVDFRMLYGRLLGGVGFALYRWALRQHTMVCCVSRGASLALERHGLVSETIANGVDTASWRPPSADERRLARDDFGLCENPTIAIVGSLIPRKDPLAALTLCERLAREGAVTVLVAGEGPLRSRMEAAARGYARLDIRFLGNVGDVRRIYWASDLLVSAAHSEGTPMACLEALSTGLPLILSDIGPHRSLERDFRGRVQIWDATGVLPELPRSASRETGGPGPVEGTEFDAREVSTRYLSLLRRTAVKRARER